METDDDHEIMRESFSSAQSILFIDYSDKLSHWTKHDLIALHILCLHLASKLQIAVWYFQLRTISRLEWSQVCCLSCLSWLLRAGLRQDLVVPGVEPLLKGDHQDQIHQGRSKTGKRQSPWDQGQLVQSLIFFVEDLAPCHLVHQCALPCPGLCYCKMWELWILITDLF